MVGTKIMTKNYGMLSANQNNKKIGLWSKYSGSSCSSNSDNQEDSYVEIEKYGSEGQSYYTVEESQNLDQIIQNENLHQDGALCLEGHKCEILNTSPDTYIGGGIVCDKCDKDINPEDWFHHCPVCQTDFCQKCSGKINCANPKYWKTWDQMNINERINSFFPVDTDFIKSVNDPKKL